MPSNPWRTRADVLSSRSRSQLSQGTIPKHLLPCRGPLWRVSRHRPGTQQRQLHPGLHDSTALRYSRPPRLNPHHCSMSRRLQPTHTPPFQPTALFALRRRLSPLALDPRRKSSWLVSTTRRPAPTPPSSGTPAALAVTLPKRRPSGDVLPAPVVYAVLSTVMKTPREATPLSPWL